MSPHPRVHFNRLSNCRVKCDIACPLGFFFLSTLEPLSVVAAAPPAPFSILEQFDVADDEGSLPTCSNEVGLVLW